MLKHHSINSILANSLKVEIPYSFIKNKVPLTWNEIYVGIIYGFIPLEGAINKAEEEILEEEKEPSGPVFQLACLYKEESSLIYSFLSKIVDKGYFEDADHIQHVKEKWLYLVLAWLHVNHEKYSILYAEQEYELTHIGEKLMIVADDFGNPDVTEEMVGIAASLDGISTDADLKNSLNIAWQEYLKRQKIRFEMVW